MPIQTLRENLLKLLAGSSSQKPVTLTKLQSLVVPKVKLAELTTVIDTMCQSRELQTCTGVKAGKAYVCYWISGNLPPAWGKPSKVKSAIKKPDTSN